MPELRRYVLTGAPGAGKTTLIEALRRQGHVTVREAATDIIAARQAQGCAEPWREPGFVDAVAALQRRRQFDADQRIDSHAERTRSWTVSVIAERKLSKIGFRRDAPGRGCVQLHDRSPLCTLALARYLGRPVGPVLAAEVDRVARQRTYQRSVFVIGPLGFIRPTAARQIGYAESLAFARVHEQVYEAYGYRLVHVPAGPVPERTALIERCLSTLDGRPRSRLTLHNVHYRIGSGVGPAATMLGWPTPDPRRRGGSDQVTLHTGRGPSANVTSLMTIR
ncbi:AAA family ATPase [Micromonospora sp. NPDC049274]|uniref:AAA family ATPase n=1 Tax=Micromonospora sp. NPDC049274 TaxID=3154829 RepID=UPI00341F3919